MKLPYDVTIFYKDKDARPQYLHFNAFDETKESFDYIYAQYAEYYLYQGCLNESRAHLASCIPDEFCQKYGYAVVSAKHWTVFFNPKAGLLRFSDDPEDEWSKTIRLTDYIIDVKKDNNKYTVYIFII